MTFQNTSDPDGSEMQWSRRGTHTWQMCECSELHISHKLHNKTEVICLTLKKNRWVTIFDSTRYSVHGVQILPSTEEQATEQIQQMVLTLNGKLVLPSFQPSEPLCTVIFLCNKRINQTLHTLSFMSTSDQLLNPHHLGMENFKCPLYYGADCQI